MRKQTTGTDLFTALVGLFGRSRRRYAGYIVHLGIVVMFFGFAGEGFKNEDRDHVEARAGDAGRPFTVRHDALRVTADAQKQMITGHVTVIEDGKADRHDDAGEVVLREARRRSRRPRSRSGGRSGEDLYIVLGGFDVADQSAVYKITVNPLVNWVWFGLGIMVIGSIVVDAAGVDVRRGDGEAAGARRRRRRCSLILLLPALAHRAARREPEPRAAVPKSTLERELQAEIICMCGTCGRERMPMVHVRHGRADARRSGEARRRRARSASRCSTTTSPKYGSQEPLASPFEQGFQPAGLAVPVHAWARPAPWCCGVMAFRWSRREAVELRRRSPRRRRDSVTQRETGR